MLQNYEKYACDTVLCMLLGVGGVKAGGNYAAAKLPVVKNAKEGFPVTLFLDAKERRYIEEFATSNKTSVLYAQVWP